MPKNNKRDIYTDPVFNGPVVGAKTPTVRTVQMTPAKARRQLAKVWPGRTRGINPLVVNQIKHAAASQQATNEGWITPTLKLDGSSRLMDGLNVLMAISQMPVGTTLPVRIQHDTPEWEIVRDHRTLSKKSIGHSLKHIYRSESITVLNIVSSAANMVNAYGKYRGSGTPENKIDFSEKLWAWEQVIEFVPQWDASLIMAARAGNAIARVNEKRPGNITTAETLAVVLWLLRDEPDAVKFFHEMNKMPKAMLSDPADPRTQMIEFYSICNNERELILRWSASYRTRTRRIAEMLGAWKAHKDGTAWTPWDGTEANFPHPAVDPADAKKLNWN